LSLARRRDDAPNDVPGEFFVDPKGSRALCYAPDDPCFSRWIQNREAKGFLDAADFENKISALSDQLNNLIVDGDDTFSQLLQPLLGCGGRVCWGRRLSVHTRPELAPVLIRSFIPLPSVETLSGFLAKLALRNHPFKQCWWTERLRPQSFMEMSGRH